MTDISEDQQSEPMHSYIGLRAFELILARGAPHGQGIEDWVQAEQELLVTKGDLSFPVSVSRRV